LFIEVQNAIVVEFYGIKFLVLILVGGEVFRHLPVRWEFPSPGWVKINNDGAARGIRVLLLVDVFFVGVWGSLLVFFVFLEVQTIMVAEFYGVIHAMEEAQKMRLINVLLECDSALVCVAFTANTNVS